MKEQIKNLIESLKNNKPYTEIIDDVTVDVFNYPYFFENTNFYLLYLNKSFHSGSKQHLLKILKEWLNDKRELIIFENQPILRKKI